MLGFFFEDPIYMEMEIKWDKWRSDYNLGIFEVMIYNVGGSKGLFLRTLVAFDATYYHLMFLTILTTGENQKFHRIRLSCLRFCSIYCYYTLVWIEWRDKCKSLLRFFMYQSCCENERRDVVVLQFTLFSIWSWKEQFPLFL